MMSLNEHAKLAAHQGEGISTSHIRTFKGKQEFMNFDALQDGLLPVPAGLLDGSLILGSITHLVLGDAANSANIAVHPFLVAGWCGLVTTALNCLPVGCLDGGRITMVSNLDHSSHTICSSRPFL